MLEKLKHYALLMRLHKPIGIYLLLWPTLWAIWIAGNGHPSLKITLIFIAGVVLMRSAGCIINDFADRDIDGFVERTCERPLATKKVSPKEALVLFCLLATVALILVLQLNRLTLRLAVIGLILTLIYPFMKRVIDIPQFILGLAFSWSIPMAFAAQTGHVPAHAWLLFSAAALWPIAYDTCYAMADRKDDLKIGVRSTAILFGSADRYIVALLQIIFFALLLCLGIIKSFKVGYFIGVLFASGFAIYQQYLIKDREPALCFKAFINNNWLGMMILLGILANYYL